MSEKEAGAVGGVAQGAMAGVAFGPIGMVVGGVIGGIFGGLSGSAASKARRAANRAKKTERKVSEIDAAIQRRDMIRGQRIAYAESLAAGTSQGEGGFTSSAPRGALASIRSQGNFNLRFFDNRVKDWKYIQQQYDKAGKYARDAQNMAGYGEAALSLFSTFGGGLFNQKPASTGSPYTKPSDGIGPYLEKPKA